MKLVIFGAPGAGKGTQADKISTRYQIAHISTGDMLRAAIKSGSELGGKVKSVVESGQLVPDGLMTELIRVRLKEKDCEKGFLLDGFPRTAAQAEALEKITEIDRVISIATEHGKIITRLATRRVCVCGATYNTNTKKDETCDACGKTIYIREDDSPETVKKRLQVFEAQSRPLIEYYQKQGVFFEVDGNGSIEGAFGEICAELDKI